MKASSLNQNKVLVKLIKTPRFLGTKSEYRLDDSAYGEWIIFEYCKPRYYFNVFDERYSKIKERLLQLPDVETYIMKSFQKKGLQLSLKCGGFGVSLPFRSKIEEFDLEKLPLEYIV
ncbi:MAG TPA: hypothetical protein VGK59_22400 [Ohtaekwangia sp.]